MSSTEKYLRVELVQGRGLPALDKSGTSDPFCKLKFGKQKVQSRVCKKTLQPVWKEKFKFKFIKYEEPLEVKVYDDDRLGHDKIGRISIDLTLLKGRSTPLEQWYSITSDKGPVGEILFRLSTDPGSSPNSSSSALVPPTPEKELSRSSLRGGESSEPEPSMSQSAVISENIISQEQIVREGWLERRSDSRHKYHKRYFVLHKNMTLIYFHERPKSPEHTATLRKSIIEIKNMKHLKRTASGHHPYAIEVACADKTFYLAQKSSEDQDGWLAALNSISPGIPVYDESTTVQSEEDMTEPEVSDDEGAKTKTRKSPASKPAKTPTKKTKTVEKAEEKTTEAAKEKKGTKKADAPAGPGMMDRIKDSYFSANQTLDGNEDLTRLLESKKIKLPLKRIDCALILGVVGFFLSILLLHFFGALISNVIGFAFPAFMSMSTIKHKNEAHRIQWFTYWLLFGFLLVIESLPSLFFSDVLVYYLLKVPFLLWCQMPSHENGATFLYYQMFAEQDKPKTA